MTPSWRKWAVVPGLVAVAATALFARSVSAQSGAAQAAVVDTTTKLDAPRGPWGYSGASSVQGYAPEQPIKFPHPVHVQQAKMNCQYCHFSANKSPDPGLPAVGTCMGCHQIVKTQSPEIVKLTKYWTDKKPVPWVRIHRVPKYAHFPHMRHVNAGVTCQSCHGQVQKMAQVFQYASLNMGWCVSCHVNGYDPAKGDLASGYTKSGAGWMLASPSPSALPTAPATGLKKARYDCASCHY